MKKFKIHNFTVLISASFLLLFLSFYFIMLKSFTHLPSENWSKEIAIQTFNFPSNIYLASQYKIYDSIPYKEGLLLSYADEKGIHIKHLSSEFKTIEESFTPYKTDNNLRKIEWVADKDDRLQLALYSIENGSILMYEIAFPSLELSSLSKEVSQVETYTLVDDSIFYFKDHFIYGIIDGQPFSMGSADEVEGLTGYRMDNAYTLLSVERIDSKRFLVHYAFDVAHGSIQRKILSPLVSDNSVTFQSLSALQVDDRLYVLTMLRNAKTNYNLANLHSFDADSFNQLANASVPFSQYVSSPTLFVEDSTLKISFIDSSYIGRSDVSRKSESYPNLALAAIENDQLKNVVHLTKTESSKINPVYHQLENQKIATWMEFDGSQYVIYGASDDPKMIEISQKLKGIDAFGIFMNSVTTYFPAFYASLVLIFSVMLPVIVLYGMLSFFKITWVERHGDLLLHYMILFHIILKFYAFIPTIKMTLVHMSDLNFFYSTFIGQILFALGLTTISLIAFRMYFKTHKHMGSFVQYLRFSFIDCLLLITAFYPLYFV